MSRARSCIYAVFALGLNVLVGYGGLVSLGHAGLFGVAAYAGAMFIECRLLATRGRDRGGARRHSLGTALFAALALRATGIGFVMITLALGQILWGLAYRWLSLTNGDNGINLSSRPAPFGLSLDGARPFITRRWWCSCSRSCAVGVFTALAVRREPAGARATSRGA